MADHTMSAEMSQFFDFGEAAMPEPTFQGLEKPRHLLVVQEDSQCPVHSHGVDSTAAFKDACLCVQNPVTVAEGLQQPGQLDFDSDFSSWLPRYQKPAHPCEYCRSRLLTCFIYTSAGEKIAGCSPCNALFRPCSFSDPDKLPALRTSTALDILDAVAENDAQCFGGRTGRKPMRSLGHVGPIVSDLLKADAAKRGAPATRFSKEAVRVLKTWLNTHAHNPYPTEEEKEALKAETGLTVGQISNWMANTRRRQKARPKRDPSPSIRSSAAVNIPAGKTWDNMNPLERWKHSPPENEPAPLTAIANAMETFDPPEPISVSSGYHGRRNNSNGSSGSISVFRAPSTTSLETGTNMSSGSGQSAWSYGSRNSFGSLNSSNSRHERRRRRRVPTRVPKLDASDSKRLFQCTFCTDRFKSKYDWARHEKSLHLSLEKWICAPLGDVITCTSSGQRKCVYCDALDPSQEHLAGHNHSSCEEKGLEARTFYRKDHLRQHLRLMHGCKMTPSMDNWKSEVQKVRSRCGFCSMNFETWQDRTDHLAKEFRNGANMKDWKGCRGLAQNVAIHVTNAMPPYLIANETLTPYPFSATNASSLKSHSVWNTDRSHLERLSPECAFRTISNSSSLNSPLQVPSTTTADTASSSTPSPHPNATCWEILTLRLGQYARQHIEQHGAASLTDDMIQTQARRILYDSDDPWNQTAADNAEWLALFKKAHGLGIATPLKEQLAGHEVREDLGLGSDAMLDESFDFTNFLCKQGDKEGDDMVGYECSLAGTMNLSKAAMQMQDFGRGLEARMTSGIRPLSEVGSSGYQTYTFTEHNTTSSTSAANSNGGVSPIASAPCQHLSAFDMSGTEGALGMDGAEGVLDISSGEGVIHMSAAGREYHVGEESSQPASMHATEGVIHVEGAAPLLSHDIPLPSKYEHEKDDLMFGLDLENADLGFEFDVDMTI